MDMQDFDRIDADIQDRKSQGAGDVQGMENEIPFSSEMAQRKMPIWEKRRKCIEVIEKQFSFYGWICFLFGVCYTVCLYHNPSGILVPVFTAASYGLGLAILKKMEVKVKKGAYFLAGISVVISIATCRTGSIFLIAFNGLAVWLLGCVFWLHQFYEDRAWNIGKYLLAVVELVFRSVSMIPYPFRHCAGYLKSVKNGRGKQLMMVLLGVVAAIPIVSALAFLLSEADMVFRQIFVSWLNTFLRPWTMISTVCMSIFGMVALYCLVCEISTREIKTEVADRRSREPLLAITVMGLVGLLYVMFCGVQVVYLFLGQGALPAGISFSDYAREGFFQLLFVTVLNTVLVLLCLKYFRESKVLKGVLTVISICTYVMIASAAYRMALYIQEYHLTLLRVLVLWCLGTLSFVMAGVVVIIYKNTFPFFGYCILVVCACYLGLSLMRPDSVIAKYNISHEAQMSGDQLSYLSSLSSDAAPEISRLFLRPGYSDSYVIKGYAMRMKRSMSFRTYNFSYAEANRCLP